jgi:hypothetical protein
MRKRTQAFGLNFSIQNFINQSFMKTRPENITFKNEPKTMTFAARNIRSLSFFPGCAIVEV